MNLFAMLQSANGHAARQRADGRAKRRATLTAKKRAKWGAAFAAHGGRAGTNALAGHMGRAAASILKSMYELEELGWVRRAGTILKSGRPGNNQIVWEWVDDAE